MSKISEVHRALIQADWSLKHNAMMGTELKYETIDKYLEKNQEAIEIKPVILAINVNHLSNLKLQQLYELIHVYNPDIMWIMEIWNKPPTLLGYNMFNDRSMHTNVLYVKSNIIRRRTIVEIPYGFKLEDICFRYVPPFAKKIELTANEIGDFNFKSHKKWISTKFFYQENALYTGMGFRLTMPNKHEFIKVLSDHSALIIHVNTIWKKYLRNDFYKLENEINLLGSKSQIGYIYKNSDTYVYPKNNTNKIINPIQKQIDITPWKELYKHIETRDNENYKPKISDGKLHKIASHAYDINNIANKMVLEILINKKNDVAQKFIMANNGQFASKTVCFVKKDKIPDKIMNLRAIQVSPINFKIAEQSRSKLKEWLIENTDARIVSFLPGKSALDVFSKIKNYLDNT